MENDEIVSIEYMGEQITVDITTDGNHLFFANDILTHNTSYDEVNFDPSHIAGGISKVNTADNVIGISTSITMKESGRYQVQFMKTRSSSGVGSRVDLSFNTKSLRISDLEESDSDAVTHTSLHIMEQLKKNSVVRSGEKLAASTSELLGTTPKKTAVNPLQGAAALAKFVKRKP